MLRTGKRKNITLEESLPSDPQTGHDSSPGSAKKQLWSGGIWVTLGRSLGIGASVIVNFVLARLLSPDDFGAFGLLSSIMTTSSVVAMFGFNAGIVRFLAESLAAGNGDRIQRVLRISVSIVFICVCIVSLIVFIGLTFLRSRFPDRQSYSLICTMTALSVGLLACNNMSACILRGLDEPRLGILMGPQSAGGPLGAGLFLILLLTIGLTLRSLESSLALYALAYGVCLPVGAIWIVSALRIALRSKLSLNADLHLPEFTPRLALGICSALMLTQILTIATRESDLWIAGTFGPPDELALYVAARRIMQTVAVPLGLVNLSVIAMIPGLWKKQQTRELQEVLQAAASVATFISGACLCVILVAPGTVLQVLFGPYYREATIPLVILSLAQFVFTWTGACELVLIMTGHERVALLINAVSTFLILVIGPIVTRCWGIVGLAALSSGIIAAQNIVQWLMVRRYLGIWTHASLSIARFLK